MRRVFEFTGFHNVLEPKFTLLLILLCLFFSGALPLHSFSLSWKGEITLLFFNFDGVFRVGVFLSDHKIRPE